MESEKKLYLILILFLLILAALGITVDGLLSSLEGLWAIQIHPARLINDYFEIAGVGGAFLNAALVGFLGLLMVKLAGIPHSGPTFAAILTMAGFGLFGKTPLNILPILAGVKLAAFIMKKPFSSYLIIALFGTALGPLVSFIAWESGLSLLPAIIAAVAGGLAIGFLLPAMAVSILHLHQGYNLYNMGFTCGFLGLFAFALLRGMGREFTAQLNWYTETSLTGALLIPVFSLILILIALFMGKKKVFSDLKKVLKLPGRLPSDFTDLVSVPGALLNCGLIGLLGSVYIFAIGADFNGPVVGGLLTIMGFGAFGTHIKNAWPVVAGVILATLLTGNNLNAPGPVLAAIFCTTLAPLAGEFGVKVGLAAGFVHLLMVLQTGAWHGGMNLYNNGFAGGLTATLFVSVIQWYRTNKNSI